MLKYRHMERSDASIHALRVILGVWYTATRGDLPHVSHDENVCIVVAANSFWQTEHTNVEK